jgi:hypothetical protein
MKMSSIVLEPSSSLPKCSRMRRLQINMNRDLGNYRSKEKRSIINGDSIILSTN